MCPHLVATEGSACSLNLPSKPIYASSKLIALGGLAVNRNEDGSAFTVARHGKSHAAKVINHCLKHTTIKFTDATQHGSKDMRDWQVDPPAQDGPGLPPQPHQPAQSSTPSKHRARRASEPPTASAEPGCAHATPRRSSSPVTFVHAETPTHAPRPTGPAAAPAVEKAAPHPSSPLQATIPVCDGPESPYSADPEPTLPWAQQPNRSPATRGANTPMVARASPTPAEQQAQQGATPSSATEQALRDCKRFWAVQTDLRSTR